MPECGGAFCLLTAMNRHSTCIQILMHLSFKLQSHFANHDLQQPPHELLNMSLESGLWAMKVENKLWSTLNRGYP